MRTMVLPLYLTRSKLRADLLSLFFLNPENSYYLRELERRLGASPGTLARELKALSGEGLLLREARGKEVFYRINAAHPLFHEIKGIVEKTVGLPRAFSDGLRKIRKVKEAYLYGSAATGKMNANSDIDLLVVGEGTDSLADLLGRLEKKFGRMINSTVFSRKEFEHKRKDKADFLYGVMNSKILQLKP